VLSYQNIFQKIIFALIIWQSDI